MQKKNECRCKLTLGYTRFSIRSAFFANKFHRQQKSLLSLSIINVSGINVYQKFFTTAFFR